METNITIIKATANDVAVLQQIAKETFIHAFSAANDQADMRQYLEKSFSIEKLKAELENAGSQFYFAKDEDEIIAYLKLNTGNAQTELVDPRSLEIERIYVKHEYHGKKVGQLLYEKAIAIAHQIKASFVWLGVWEENPRAIQFYKKNGFIVFNKHFFQLGNEVQTDLMMKKKLD